MIKCFRCGTPAKQLPDGTVERACDCYQPSLLYTYPPQVYLSNTTTIVPLINESANTMPSRPCPICGELVFSLLYHRCRGIGSAPTPEPQAQPEQPESEVSQERAKRIYAMITDQIIVHRENCTGCHILGRPCVQILPTVDLQEKWQKKAGVL